jgi:adhesin transport system outer membrane protein
MKRKHWTMIVPGAVLLCTSPAYAVELRDAVQSALSTNPEIRQAVANRVATQEERVQAQGLWYPRVSVEGSAGIRSLRNPTRRAIGIADSTLYPVEGDLIVDQLLFNSGGREAEIKRQAARTDAAASRVEERSEFVALNVARTYIDYLLQQRLVAIAEDNATFHERLAGDLREGVSKGSISVADQQQAEERLQSARARVTEAKEDLESAGITFRTLTGMPIDSVSMPPDLSQFLPATLEEAEALARQNNPRVQEALADLATSREEIRAARAEIGPRVNLEGRARAGHDIDGFAGRTTDLQANVVLRWMLYNGGIKEANVREQQNRADEVHGRLFERTRQAEEDTRTAWNRLQNQSRLVTELETQGRITDDLLLSYRVQFYIGRRSLLDVLDAQ